MRRPWARSGSSVCGEGHAGAAAVSPGWSDAPAPDRGACRRDLRLDLGGQRPPDHPRCGRRSATRDLDLSRIVRGVPRVSWRGHRPRPVDRGCRTGARGLHAQHRPDADRRPDQSRRTARRRSTTTPGQHSWPTWPGSVATGRPYLMSMPHGATRPGVASCSGSTARRATRRPGAAERCWTRLRPICGSRRRPRSAEAIRGGPSPMPKFGSCRPRRPAGGRRGGVRADAPAAGPPGRSRSRLPRAVLRGRGGLGVRARGADRGRGPDRAAALMTVPRAGAA